MLDNKFLKHPGMGLKLMLPIELTRFIDREDREFYQRARLDKQNMVHFVSVVGRGPSRRGQRPHPGLRRFRLQADVARPVRPVGDRPAIDGSDAIAAGSGSLFKFLYRLFVDHCVRHTDNEPVWQISSETLEATLAVYVREQDAFDRGVGPG